MKTLRITDLYVDHEIELNPTQVTMVQPWNQGGVIYSDAQEKTIYPKSRIAWYVGQDAFYAMTSEPFDILVARWKAALSEW